MQELIVDSFAGGGGASTGIEMALCRRPTSRSTTTRSRSPCTRSTTRKRCICRQRLVGRPRGPAAAGPSGCCGPVPIASTSRKPRAASRWKAASATWHGWWCAGPTRSRPRVIMLENVEEFSTWGPLASDGRPCAARKGQTFRRWVGS